MHRNDVKNVLTSETPLVIFRGGADEDDRTQCEKFLDLVLGGASKSFRRDECPVIVRMVANRGDPVLNRVPGVTDRLMQLFFQLQNKESGGQKTQVMEGYTYHWCVCRKYKLFDSPNYVRILQIVQSLDIFCMSDNLQLDFNHLPILNMPEVSVNDQTWRPGSNLLRRGSRLGPSNAIAWPKKSSATGGSSSSGRKLFPTWESARWASTTASLIPFRLPRFSPSSSLKKLPWKIGWGMARSAWT